jgi:hypothetical protein
MTGIICSIAGATYAAAARNTITTNGNAQVSTAQSQFGGASALFDGTGDYLTIPGSSNFDFGTGNWTIEMWFRRISGGAIDIIVGNRSTGFVSGNFAFYTYSSSIEFDYRNALVSNNTLTTSISNDTWFHFAIVRNGTSYTLYKDGVSAQTKTIDAAETFGSSSINLSIGCNTAGTFPLNGYIDELRISKTARYTAGFTPSTSAFTNDANTVLLIHADGTNASTTFTDDNSLRNQKSISTNGNAQVSTAQSKFGGASALFDGNGDYLNSATGFSFAGDFTVEFFVRFASIGANSRGLATDRPPTSSGYTTSNWYIEKNTNNGLFAGISGFGDIITSDSLVTTNTWYHIAFVRSGTTVSLYLDGTSRGTPLTCGTSVGDGDISFGAIVGLYLDGYMDEIRVSNCARYTTTFTPTTAAFTNDGNTLLLIHADGTNASTTFTDDNA